MKILIVSNMYPDKNNPSYGVFVKRFCNQIEKIGIDYDKSVMYKENSKLKKLIRYIMFYIITILKIMFKRYDLVYIHYASHSGLPVLLMRKIKHFKIYTNVHGSDVVPENSKQEKFQKFTKKLMCISDKIIVPSEYFKDYIIKKYLIEEQDIYIYPSAGINPQVFYKYDKIKKNEIKMNLKISNNNEIIIGFVGRIAYGKGWDTFIKALNDLNIKLPDLRFKAIIVGEGSEEKKLNYLITNTNLDDRVVRLGLLSQEKLADIYNCLSIFIFPTEREGESLGLVALEAMACGVPAIASDFAAPKYYIKDELNGYKFTVKEFKDLSAKIEKYIFLTEDEKYILSRNAHVTASEYFEDNLLEKLKKIFNI